MSSQSNKKSNFYIRPMIRAHSTNLLAKYAKNHSFDLFFKLDSKLLASEFDLCVPYIVCCEKLRSNLEHKIQGLFNRSSYSLGGIQLGRPQKIGLFGPPPPPCPHFRPQRPDPLPFRTSARPDPPLKKEKSLQNAWLQL